MSSQKHQKEISLISPALTLPLPPLKTPDHALGEKNPAGKRDACIGGFRDRPDRDPSHEGGDPQDEGGWGFWGAWPHWEVGPPGTPWATLASGMDAIPREGHLEHKHCGLFSCRPPVQGPSTWVHRITDTRHTQSCARCFARHCFTLAPCSQRTLTILRAGGDP